MSTSSPLTPSENFDPESRRLCPDGACIGVLDERGRCKECGLSDGGAAPGISESPTAPAYDEGDQAAAPVSPGDAFDPDRALCPDGACVGVIGADGRCKICDKSQDA